MNTFLKIRQWAAQKNIHQYGNREKQFLKLNEEVGELAQAMLKDDLPNIQNELGDCVVVLTILAHQQNFRIEDCLELAYNKIEKRKGETVNGVFVKDAGQ